MSKWAIHHGDALEVLKAMPDASFDAVLCDPPYGLSFMGKEWDHGVPSKDVWAEALRVLKPGAFLLAFGGTRTFHRLTCAIEDAGFEIRDCVSYLHGPTNPLLWIYASGFPKSHNFGCRCQEARPTTPKGDDGVPRVQDAVHAESIGDAQSAENGRAEDMLEKVRGDLAGTTNEPIQKRETEPARPEDRGGLRGVREGQADEPFQGQEGGAPDLLKEVQRYPSGSGMGETRAQGTGCQKDETLHEAGVQPGMEGRRDIQAEQGELHRAEVCEVPRSVPAHGPEGRLHHGAPAGDGDGRGQVPPASGSSASRGPRHQEQRAGEPGAVAGQCQPQGVRSGATCPRCGKPASFVGYGTALKPAWEPCIVAMKPLEGTFAENALRHGVAGLNIEAGRIAGDVPSVPQPSFKSPTGQVYGFQTGEGRNGEMSSAPNGRWPANLILDESFDQDWSRFFYCAKASRRERNAGVEETGEVGHVAKMTAKGGAWECLSCGRKYARMFDACPKCGSTERETYTVGSRPVANAHPCVKPLDLNRYLASLILPPKRDTPRRILVPFSGSGSEMIGCLMAGWDEATGIEREAEYVAIAEARLAHWIAAPKDFEPEPVDTPAPESAPTTEPEPVFSTYPEVAPEPPPMPDDFTDLPLFANP